MKKEKTEEKVVEFYNKIARKYDSFYERPYWKLYNEVTWHNIKKFLPKKKNAVILDAGGGTGFWAVRLAKLGYKVVLTDIAEEMLKVAEIKVRKEGLEGKIEVQKVDIRNMSCFSSSIFDMVLAQGDPVSYCMNPKKAIKELARVVKPNSPVIISVDNKYSVLARKVGREEFKDLDFFIRKGIFEFEGYKSITFTPEEIRDLFKSAGLKTVRIIGKLAVTELIPGEKKEEIIKRYFKKLLDLELKFCENPYFFGVSPHIEIVGIKK